MSEKNPFWPMLPDDEPDKKDGPQDPFPHVRKMIKPTGKVFDIHLSEVIDDYDEIKEITMMLRMVSAEDKVNLYLGGYGGGVAYGIELLNALDESKAAVQTIITAPVYSMHSMLAMAQEDVTIRDSVYFMFHDISTMAHGKLSEIKEQVENHKIWTKNLFDRCSRGALTEKEIEDILDGKDKWISGDEMRKRMDKRKKAKEIKDSQNDENPKPKK